MQTPEQIIPTFAPETRFDVEPQILPLKQQNSLHESPALCGFRRGFEILDSRGISFSALND